MEYTFDEDIVSDLHKDAYGMRPSQTFWSNWNSFTDAEKQSTWDYLIEALERSVAAEEAREKEAIARFEKSVADTISAGAADRATAIRWLMDAEMEEYFHGDVEHFEYLMGIPFNYIKKTAGV